MSVEPSTVNEMHETVNSETSIPELRTGLNVQTICLVALTALSIIFFLKWARAVFIPIALAILLSYALTPIVNWLQRRVKIQKAIGAALILVAGICLLGLGLKSLSSEALEIIDIVPRAMQKLTVMLRPGPTVQSGAIAKIQKVAAEIEKAANTAAATPTGNAAPRSVTEPLQLKIRDYILMGTVSLAAGIGQFVVVIALVYFLLIAGDTFRRTLVRISEATLSSKKITIQLLDEINAYIQRYLLVQLVTSALFGLIAWVTFVGVGLDNAGIWALIGAVLHLIPFIGIAVYVGVITLVTHIQLNTLPPVATIIGFLLVGNALIAFLLVPWLTQAKRNLNAVTVFITLLVWGWLWGIWGLLLGVPIVMVVKAISDRIDALQPIGAFLGNTLPKPPPPSPALSPS